MWGMLGVESLRKAFGEFVVFKHTSMKVKKGHACIA